MPPTTDPLERVKRRIRALQAKTLDAAATEEEAASAAALASRLMREHDLADGDLRDRSDRGAPDFESYDSTNSYARAYYWPGSLAALIAGTMVGGVHVYYNRRADGRIRLRFSGEADRGKIAADLFDDWCDLIDSTARRLYGGALRGSGQSYATGFVNGMRDAVYREKADASETSTAVAVHRDMLKAKTDAAKGWVEERTGRLQTRKRRGHITDGAAYDKGRQHGASAPDPSTSAIQ